MHPNAKHTNLQVFAQMHTNTVLSAHTQANLKQSVRSGAGNELHSALSH